MSNTPVPPAGPTLPVAPLPPAVPQPKPNNAMWWILGILGGGLVILVFFGLTLAGLIVRHIHIANDGNKVAIETPIGDLKVNKGEPHATGLAVYPAATSTGENNGTVQLGTDDEGLGIAAEEYETRDALDKVRDWYRSHLGSDFEMETNARHGSQHSKINGVEVGNHEIAFVSERRGGARIVALDKSFHGTKIKLVRVGTREAQ
ncbi:MAG TPA: hypothetical protein VNY97_01885 [Candidatus Angelobacter sp.]|jgi:hypothetical protein|nr:hypothetical protein [Candidatus Angelobacter sp.]